MLSIPCERWNGVQLALIAALVFLTEATLLTPRSSAQIVRIAAGGLHNIVAASNGDVWTWGLNAHGQLGNGTFVDGYQPTQISGIPPIIGISGGAAHTLAIDSQGNVWAWGRSSLGALGTGSSATNAIPFPVQAAGISNVVKIAAGSNHSLALRNDGTLWAWGYNQLGQVGDGTTTQRDAPVLVGSLLNVVAVAAGDDYSLALRGDGTVWAWGSDSGGQLGRGTNPPSSASSIVPTQVAQLSNIVAISAGTVHAMALRDDGAVFIWGSNSLNQLGSCNGTSTAIPSVVATIPDAVGITCGHYQSFVVRANGEAVGIGRNDFGQLGTGTSGTVCGTAAVTTTLGFLEVAGGSSHTLALCDDGRVATWGLNLFGELGTGLPLTASPTPIAISILSQLSPCANGNVGVGFGGPFNVLFVNGSAGGPPRRVDVTVASPFSISVAQPPTNIFPALFAIVGFIGVPTAADITPLPFNVGTLCFPSYHLNPGQPGLFVLTNNYGPDAFALVPSTPAPWSLTVNGLPFPFQFTLQGVINQDPVTVRVTNGVLVNVQ